MQESAKHIVALIEREVELGTPKENIFLAGYGQGGRLIYHIAFGQLTYALGGYFVMAAAPQYPLNRHYAEWAENGAAPLTPSDPNYAAAKAYADNIKSKFSYYESDMNWFMFQGAND